MHTRMNNNGHASPIEYQAQQLQTRLQIITPESRMTPDSKIMQQITDRSRQRIEYGEKLESIKLST